MPWLRINTVLPRFYVSPQSRYTFNYGTIIKRTPQKRLGNVTDIARVVCFLANSPAADFITGSTVTVDDGLSLMGLNE